MISKSLWFASAVLIFASLAFGQVTGSGTKGAIPVWTGKTSIGNSPIVSVSGSIGIGTKSPGALLDVQSSSTSRPAVNGTSFAGTGTATGVQGQTASPTGAGVLGQNYSTTGAGAATRTRVTIT